MTTKRRYRDSASFGKREEFSVIAKLLKKSFDVYNTLVDDKQIDCVIRISETRYLDIQIKASSKSCLPKDAGRFASMNIPNPRENYFFIFFSEHINKYWVIPSLELVKFAKRSKKGKSIGKYHIMLTGFRKGKPYPLPKFKDYEGEDAFDLLK